MPKTIDKLEDCVDYIISEAGKKLTIATPLGIGKPNDLINKVWNRAKKDTSIELEIFTALSLNPPKGKNLLQTRFLAPFCERHFGNYEPLDYVTDMQAGTVPAHMRVTEFYMQSGKNLKNPLAQRWYTSSNYTHAARDMASKNVNVILQIIAHKPDQQKEHYSLGSNPDLTLDLVEKMRQKGAAKPLVIGVINPHMPYMLGDAEVKPDFFDVIITPQKNASPLFAAPKQAINPTDHMIGLLASQLVEDGGTLQIGIGSLGDAFVNASIVRHKQNTRYKGLIDALQINKKFPSLYHPNNLEPYDKGLYGASEMFMEGFEHLFNAGILKREVYDHAAIQKLINENRIDSKLTQQTFETLLKHQAISLCPDDLELHQWQQLGIIKKQCQITDNTIQSESGESIEANFSVDNNKSLFIQHCLNHTLNPGYVLHAAFFLGSASFYAWLKNLDEENKRRFQMTRVSRINQLYGGEALDRAQRIKARFINTTMKVTLTGAACSDGLINNQVVSGIGGQYNFVAMGHALEDSRSILMLRSTRMGQHSVESNIVWEYPYISIPRHLRDIVITEYGYADLRSKSDEDCVKAMICIADSRFQHYLTETAQQQGKLDKQWQLPAQFKNNYPQAIHQFIQAPEHADLFTPYPFGSDFDEIELKLISALSYLKNKTKNRFSTLKTLLAACFTRANASDQKYLQRMRLSKAKNLQEKLAQKLLIWALNQ